MKDSAIAVLLPKTKTITICGQAVNIGPLTLRQLDKGLKLIQSAAVKIASDKPADDTAVMLGIFKDLGDRAEELVAVLTGLAPEAVANVSVEEVSELALAVAELNDFGKIFSNFTAAMEKSIPKK